MMNLNRPNANDALQTRNRSRDIAPQSGICSRCLDGCKGNCDIFKATFRGRELLYPEPFGSVTAGADKDYPVDYSHLNIMGYALGAKGIEADPDKATFPNVDTETEYGVNDKVKMKVPIFTGALGSTDIARKNWDHFAIGAAISGISLVCGENVCGIDPELEIGDNGLIKNSPEMDPLPRRLRRHHGSDECGGYPQWRGGICDR
jgi:glutamate synthase domain-containing protein 2